ATIQERMEPGRDEDALRASGAIERAVEDREAHRRLAAGIDRAVELGFELGVKRCGGVGALGPYGRGGQRGARSRAPVEPSPPTPAPGARRQPGAPAAASVD